MVLDGSGKIPSILHESCVEQPWSVSLFLWSAGLLGWYCIAGLPKFYGVSLFRAISIALDAEVTSAFDTWILALLRSSRNLA